MWECPSIGELEAMGFDSGVTFGMEFEFYCVDEDRDGVAERLCGATDIDVQAEHYNHNTRSYWKIVTDASLGDEDDGDYNCGDCECTQECDHDCAYSCTPTYDCRQCLVQTWEGEDEDDRPECGDCEELNDYPTYDCCDCSQERWCDECCGDHCDRTSSGASGMELVSPILVGRDGLVEMYAMMNALSDLDCHVDDSCGLHIHLGAGNLRLKDIKNLAALAVKYESTVDSILPVSRRNNCNCKSLMGRRWGNNVHGETRLERLAGTMDQIDSARVVRDIVDIWRDRYVKVNLESIGDHDTVEFRQHGGTMNAEKALHWTVLCMLMRKRAIRAPKVKFSSELHLSLESMMDDLRLGEVGRAYWTVRRDQFGGGFDTDRADEDRNEMYQIQVRAERENEEYSRAAQEGNGSAPQPRDAETGRWIDVSLPVGHTVNIGVVGQDARYYQWVVDRAMNDYLFQTTTD